MNYYKELKKINFFIHEYKIDVQRIGNHKIWPLIRVQIIDSILIKKDVLGKRNHSEITIRDIGLIVKNSLKSCFSIVSLLLSQKTKKYVFAGFSRRVLESNQYIDKFHDPIIESLPSEDCLMLEKPFQKTHYPDRATKCAIIDIDLLVYLSETSIFLLKPFLRKKYQTDVDNLVSMLSPIYDDKQSIERVVYKELSTFITMNLFNRILLKKLKPQKVIVTTKWIHRSLLYCANIAGIETYELQHGVTLKQNIAYSRDSDGDMGVKNFLAFGDYWCKGYQWGGDVNVIPFGFKYINNKVAEVVNKVEPNISHVERILFISQPELFKKTNQELNLLAKDNIDKQFILKLHPQDVGRYEERYNLALNNSNVSVISNKSIDNYILFSEVDYVIGYNSTLLYEALYFDCSVHIINLEKQDLFLTFGDSLNYFHQIFDCKLSFNSKNKKKILISQQQENKRMIFKYLSNAEIRDFFKENK